MFSVVSTQHARHPGTFHLFAARSKNGKVALRGIVRGPLFLRDIYLQLGLPSPTQPQAALIYETKLPNGLNPPKNCGAATANCCCCWTTSAELERAYYLQLAAGVSPLGLSTVSPHPPNLNLKFGLKGLTPSRKSGSSQFGWARLNRKQYQDMLF